MPRPQSPTPGPIVRLEVRLGAAPPAVYEVGDGGFLVGSVPGCDLRLPGPSLPPVVCLIARHSAGASLRKLAPVLPVSVNGRTVSSTYLDDGDRLGVGPVELLVRVQHTGELPPVTGADLDERLRELGEREQLLEEQKQELETARIFWHKRQEEIEAECRQRMQQLEKRAAEVREHAPAVVQEELNRRRGALDAREADLERQRAEVETLRQEIDGIRKELATKYQERRERLLTQQQAVHKVARKLRKRKAGVEEREARAVAAEQELATRQMEIEGAREQLERERQLVGEQHGLFASRQQEVQRELHQRFADLEAREAGLAHEKAGLEKGQKQHQADLVRLDRIQAAIESRQKALEGRALEIDRKFEQLQRDSRDLEDQAKQLDDWHNRLSAEDAQLQTRKAEVDTITGQLDQRASALEGQQAMLATLRTRLERIREDLRGQEQALSDQRALQEASEADLADRIQQAERERLDLANDRQLFDEERRRYEERRATLDQAVAALREAQGLVEKEQTELESRQREIDLTAGAQGEQAELLLVRGEQLEQVNAKLQADRVLLRGREETLAKAELTLAALQEQLRKRVEELNDKQKGLEQAVETLAQQRVEYEARRAEGDNLHRQAVAELEQLRQQVEQHATEVVARQEELAQAQERLEDAEQTQASQRQALAAERVSWEVERQVAQEQDRQWREEFHKAREEAQALGRLLPELELRATAALERLARSREQLREHLAEIHTYARQSREDLDVSRKLVQADLERVRQQELDLEVARDEHRLAVAGFRQQLIDWQGRVGEMRQHLHLGSTRLELREAELQEQARQVADTTARLAGEAEQLEQARQAVTHRRGVMDLHLNDMQEWYRRKLRDLAGIDAPAGSEPQEGDVVPMPAPGPARATTDDRSPARAVLTLNDEVDPADRQLGELLSSLGLVDEDTLQALWADARRQRRSLRQLLLAGGYLTLYQMALIEAGNLDGLVLGPVRIIDKLASTPREAVYRVFDPSRKIEAMLRHLAESEMHDAVHPDEFHQRFAAAAAVRHPNVQAVLDVLAIAGRPAALVEWVSGLPSADWPGLVSAPGVWYRLVCQAALALQSAHQAGLSHGHLDSGSFVLTGEGTLKLVGLGEPGWLAARPGEEADLYALGRLAADWASRLPVGKGAKAKPLPAELQAVLGRLISHETDRRYPSIETLVADLEQAGAKVAASTPAWERLVKQAREQKTPGLRESA